MIGAAQGLFLLVFLLKKKENKIANRFLAVTMFFFAIDLVLEAAAVTGDLKQYPRLIGLMQTLPYLYGPAIYLYILFITKGVKKFRFSFLYHYTPFILAQAYSFFFFYFEPQAYQLNWIERVNPFPWHLHVVNYLMPIIGGFYMILAVYEVYKYNNQLKDEFSTIDKHNSEWINFIITGSVLLWITAVIMTILHIIFVEVIKPELVSYFAISIFVYAMAYKGLKQPEVIVVEGIKSKSGPEEFKSYKKSGLKVEDADQYLKKLMKIMDEEKPYRNEKLSLTDLSTMLGISTHNLSELINTKIEQNFYDFVNSYRVEEVQRLIEKDKNSAYSILAHGFEAGFSSKSAFYSAFKKFTGQTPAQFRKEIL